MGRKANYIILQETASRIVIRDVGPWDRHFTVTNDAENVVLELAKQGKLPAGRRLFYYDSENDLDEILIKNGKFAGFAPGSGRGRES